MLFQWRSRHCVFAAEDGALPEPSGHDSVGAREDVRAALAEGAYLVSVPLIDNDSAVVRANVTFERGLLEAIDEAARACGLTRGSFLATDGHPARDRGLTGHLAARSAVLQRPQAHLQGMPDRFAADEVAAAILEAALFRDHRPAFQGKAEPY
jgi:hypothetical protein